MTSIDKFNSINIQWIESVKDISEEDWNKIFGSSLIKSRKLFIAMEDSSFNDVKYHYLLMYKNNVIINIIPCFCYKLDLLHLITSNRFKAFISRCRSIFPNLLKVKTFVVGSYMATCEHFIEKKDELISCYPKLLNFQLKMKFKETKSHILFIKDVRQREISYVQNILGKEFYFFKSFPTTAIPILGDEILYPNALKKKNRKRYRLFKQKFDSRYTWEICYDFEKYVNKFSKLYLSVLDKASNKFEILNSSFFSNINRLFPQKSFLLIARNKNDEIVLAELIMEEEERLLPLYLGIDYKKGDTITLYLNAIFRTIKEAEYRKKNFVDFGQTSYYPKVMSGAFVEYIYYGFWSNKPFLSWMIHNVFKYIFILPYIPKNVYLKKYKDQAINILKNNKFLLAND